MKLTIEKDENLGLFTATVDVDIPPFSVTLHKADRSDFEYEIRSRVSSVVEEYVQAAIKDQF